MMSRKKGLISLSLALFLGPALGAEQHSYLEYETFRALTALVPEAPNAKVVNLTEAGFQNWSQGQLRLPAGSNLVEGDFNQDGRLDAALIFQAMTGRFLLIASQIQNHWVRQTVFKLQEQTGITLDAKVLVVAPPMTYIAWNGHQYRMTNASPHVVPPVTKDRTSTPVNTAGSHSHFNEVSTLPPSQSVASELKIEIEAERPVVKNTKDLDVRTKIRNVNKEEQTLWIWSCSYSDHWRTDSPLVHVSQVPCDKNAMIKARLKPGEAYERILAVHVAVAAEELTQESVTFRMGFQRWTNASALVDLPIVWSNALTVKIKE